MNDDENDDLDNEDDICEIKNITLQRNNNDNDDEIFKILEPQQWFDEEKANLRWASRERLLKTCFELRNK